MNVFGIDFFKGGQAELVHALTASAHDPFGYVVTTNVNHVVMLEHDQAFKASYDGASYRICDSRVLMPVLRKFNAGVPEAIPGSTLTAAMIEVAQRERWTVTVIGSTLDVLDAVAQRYPGIRFNHYNPPMGFINDPQQRALTIDYIEQHPAELIVFSVGSPRQEILCLQIAQRGQAKGVALCTGAALNFLSGKVQRAPLWVQKLSLEWAHRILSEPRRLAGRYWHDGVRILPIVLRQFAARREQR